MIFKKLAEVQSELKCSKGQFNSYGKYRYRSQEDILEAVKPILKKVGAALVLSDEMVEIRERIYVKATASLIDINSGESIFASAFARESEEKKGMDSSQVTGSSSSYARKYALNGLFAIDDTKDADYIQGLYGDEIEKAPEKITEGQVKLIRALVKDEKQLCEYYKVNDIYDLTKDQANLIITKKGNKK